jgi:ABC-type Fe3+/spermidine/putrescine transport system ATPase subunit
VITVSAVHKSFKSGQQTVTALRGIDAEVQKGEFFVLLGPSGSGKTTLMRCIAGLEKPDAGHISLDGKTVFSSSPRSYVPPEQRQIGMVFQSYAIWPHMTVAENIGLVLTHGPARLSRGEAKERIRHVLHLVQLDDFETRPARLLSGGQQQRVALARALAINPKLLLMDEPLSNLDARLREEVRAKIKKLVNDLGITVLYVTHDQVEAMVLADRIGVMAHGEILQVGNPYELYRNPKNSLVAEFFGSINWLRGKVLDKNCVETEIGKLDVDYRGQASGNVVVGIRPEDMRINSIDNGSGNRVEATVASSTFVGDQMIFEIRIENTVLTAKAMPEGKNPDGDVSVYFPKEKIVVFPEASPPHPSLSSVVGGEDKGQQ